MKFVSSMWQLIVAACQHFYSSTIAPANEGEEVPPIRFDDDAKDIYLA